MDPSHSPSGHCRACAYPMDPGRCPECGTDCPDVSPLPRRRPPWSAIGWATLVGLTPACWIAASILFCNLLLAYRTKGLAPGSAAHQAAFTSVWKLANVAFHLHISATPIAVAILLSVLLILQAKRDKPGWKVAAVLLITPIVAAASWFGGFIAMFLTGWLGD